MKKCEKSYRDILVGVISMLSLDCIALLDFCEIAVASQLTPTSHFHLSFYEQVPIAYNQEIFEENTYNANS